MSADTFLAVDWGTTNRRAYRIVDGIVDHTERDAWGILAMPEGGYPSAVADLRSRLGGGPLLLAGMVGSNRGWTDAGYRRCPVTIEDLAKGLHHVGDDIAIVPGICVIDGARGDVMRGEEVQLLGAIQAGLAPRDATLCQPGTHAKWATVRDGAIIDFSTAMTGEMFALLRDHAMIGSAMTGEVVPSQAFRDGVARAREGDLLAALFGVRPSVILDLRPPGDVAAYVSGLLIGSDCLAQIRAGGAVHVLADRALGDLYVDAVATLGGSPVLVDSHAAFVAGIVHIRELAS